jgi:hypothetical protein
MAIEIVSFPIKNGGSFHSYVNVYQRVDKIWQAGQLVSLCNVLELIVGVFELCLKLKSGYMDTAAH